MFEVYLGLGLGKFGVLFGFAWYCFRLETLQNTERMLKDMVQKVSKGDICTDLGEPKYETQAMSIFACLQFAKNTRRKTQHIAVSPRMKYQVVFWLCFILLSLVNQ